MIGILTLPKHEIHNTIHSQLAYIRQPFRAQMPPQFHTKPARLTALIARILGQVQAYSTLDQHDFLHVRACEFQEEDLGRGVVDVLQTKAGEPECAKVCAGVRGCVDLIKAPQERATDSLRYLSRSSTTMAATSSD